MKLWSFVQVNLWCRSYQKQQKNSISGKRRESFSINRRRDSEDLNGNVIANGYKDHPNPTLVQYPDNLSLRDLLYFLCAPTLCYELNFPRTTRIRKRFLIKRVLEVMVGINILMALFQQWMIPSVKNSLVPFSNMEFTKATERLLKLAVSSLSKFEFKFQNFAQLFLDSKSLHLAVRFLLNVPLVLQPVRRDSPLRRPQLLLWLVELKERRRVLADMEHAGAPMVRSSPLPADDRVGLWQDDGVGHSFLRLRLLPRIFGVGAVEDLQDLGVSRHDGTDPAVVHLEIPREKHGRAVGQRGCVGIAHTRPAALHPRLLPRLRHRKLQRHRARVFKLSFASNAVYWSCELNLDC